MIVFAGSCMKTFRRLWRLRWTTGGQQRPMTTQSTTTGQRYDCQCTHDNLQIYIYYFFLHSRCFNYCFTHLQINDWVVSISSANAGLISRQVIGNTYEGRPMHLLKVKPLTELCKPLWKRCTLEHLKVLSSIQLRVLSFSKWPTMIASIITVFK